MDDRGEAGPADPVDRFSRRVDWQAGLQRCLTSDIHAGTCLEDTAQDDITDLGGLDCRSGQGSAHDHPT
jgi:hypothetical protein